MKTNYASLSPEERRQYDYDFKKVRDYHAELGHVRKKILFHYAAIWHIWNLPLQHSMKSHGNL